MENNTCDFVAWATKHNILCGDGRTIKKDAFKDCDGKTVPLLWSHNHRDMQSILGHALLSNRDEGVLMYGYFNDTPLAQQAKTLVKHGDINAVSIWANQLTENNMGHVSHGDIKEVSLVLAGANPGASIQYVMSHDGLVSDNEAEIYTDECIINSKSEIEKFTLSHSDDSREPDSKDKDNGSKDDKDGEGGKEKDEKKEKTIGDVIETMNDEQKLAVAALLGMAGTDSDGNDGDDNSEGGKKEMKHNVFEQNAQNNESFLSHADEEQILALAKQKSVGTLQSAINIFMDENKDHLSHGIDDMETLFPDYRDVRPGAPEFIDRDQGWVGHVINKVHKSPFSRIRTRQADIRDASLRGRGYQKGKYKKEGPNFKLLSRTTDPQTVYRKDALNRDDIIDITDFEVADYQYRVMRRDLNEEIATAIMIGDGREEGDEAKIYGDKIRPIWLDDEIYTIHTDIDLDAAKAELQGSDTGKHFGENYIRAEAVISASLYTREQYRGSGALEFYCTPHTLNVMLLAKDLNGRRIYSSKSDLEAALNVSAILTAEQFENKVRTTKDSKKKKLLGLFVNLDDYSVGSTKGGEITRFQQFDIDFNQEKYLIETRLCGALTRAYSAIALEEDVTDSF